jgi:hypothetical protein
MGRLLHDSRAARLLLQLLLLVVVVKLLPHCDEIDERKGRMEVLGGGSSQSGFIYAASCPASLSLLE